MSGGRVGLSQRAASGMLWSGGGLVAVAVLRIATLAVLARLLTPTEFGVFGAALVVIGFSEVLARFGLGPTLIQRRVVEPRHVRTAFTTSILIGLMVGAFVWALAPVVESFLRVDGVGAVIRVLALLFPLKSLGVVAQALLRREMEFRWLANREVLTFAVAYAPVGIATAAMGWGVWALVAATVSQTTINTVVLLLKRPPGRGRPFDVAAFRELAAFGAGVSFARVGQYLALQGDNLVVGRWLGAEALGLYGRAYQLMAMPAQMLGPVLTRVLFPAMSRLQDQRQRLGVAYRRGVTAVGLVVLPATGLLVALAPEIIQVLLGDQWTDAIVPFQILSVGLLFRVSVNMSDAVYKAIGAVFRGLWRQWLFGALVLLGAGIGLRWGINGVAAGVTVAYFFNFLLMAQLSLNLAQIDWRTFWAAHSPGLRLGLLTGSVAYGSSVLVWQIGAGSLGRLLIGTVCAVGMSLLAVWRLPVLFLGNDGLWAVRTVTGALSIGPPRIRFNPRRSRCSTSEAAGVRSANGDVRTDTETAMRVASSGSATADEPSG